MLKLVITDENRLWAPSLMCITYHDEFCEYDGKEDGEAVCAGECVEFAEQITGVRPPVEES